LEWGFYLTHENEMSKQFKRGDLLLPKTKVAKDDWLYGLYHPAVIWQDEFDGEGDFHGVMLSSKLKGKNYLNIPMKEKHFEKGHEKGYYSSHFANQLFNKSGEWNPFEKVGRLTDEGIKYIEDNLTNLDPIFFIEYHEEFGD
jgi:hypothetical protein